MTIDAEVRSDSAVARVVRFDLDGPADNLMSVDDGSYWLDLCLTPRPRNARACYPERWNPKRFERLGKIFLKPPGETLQARSDGGHTSQLSVLCQLQPDALREAFDGDIHWTDRALESCLDLQDANIRGLMLRLAHEARNPGFAGQTLVELIIGQLTIELGRYCVRVNEAPITGGLAPWRLRLIDERLRDISSAPSLTELAGLCKISVRQLTRGFRASRGCSIGDYVANSRIDHAKRLLLAAESVKSVAYTLGFSSPSSFCFAFRRSTGVAPREYRRRLPSID